MTTARKPPRYVLANGALFSATKWVRRFARDRRGNMAITAAFVLPVATAAVGAAVAYSNSNSIKSKLQTAVDGAVLAGAVDGASSADQIAAAKRFFDQNLAGYTSVNSSASVTSKFASDGTTVTGEATGDMENPFSGLIGSSTVSVTATSSAQKLKYTVCVLSMNASEKGAFNMNGNPTFSAPKCTVQANSSSTAGMNQDGKPTATAARFGVWGGHKGDNFSPAVVDGSEKISDPYASLAFPTADLCANGKKSLDVKAGTTLSPGTYCGGINITGSGTVVTLTPGVYIMSGGPLKINSGAVVTGDRVMIAFTGADSTLDMAGSSTLTLTSPTSGAYANMQFMQDKSYVSGKSLSASIGGTANVSFDGAAYFPTQTFSVQGDAVVTANSPSFALVADTLSLQGNAQVTVTTNNTRNLSVTAAQQAGNGAVLIR